MGFNALMTLHSLDTLRNSITNPYNLQTVAKLGTTWTSNIALPGACAHLDSSTGKLEPGLDVTTGYKVQMPLFLWQGSEDYDVVANSNAAVANGWAGSSPTGNITCLVGTGGWELETTEFNDVSYAINDPLTAVPGDMGKLSKATVAAASSTPVVGIVSQTVTSGTTALKNCHGTKVLRFWTYYLPKLSAT